jgi:hypothetical protein
MGASLSCRKEPALSKANQGKLEPPKIPPCLSRASADEADKANGPKFLSVFLSGHRKESDGAQTKKHPQRVDMTNFRD